MTDKRKPGEQIVNLGLSEILARAEAPSGVEPAAARGETSVYALTDGDLAFEREFFSLAEAKKWGVLVSRAEQTISNEEDIEARLWWIRGHLGALTLPVSLLAAPFETVCRQLKPDEVTDVYRNLIAEIGQIMLTRLNDVGDTRQAVRVHDTLQAVGVLSGPSSSKERIPSRAPVFAPRNVAEATPSAEPLLRAESRSRSSVKMMLGGGVLLVALLTGALFLWDEGSVFIVSDTLLPQSSALTQELPMVQAREVSGSLGALYYSLSTEKQADSDKPVATPPVVSPRESLSPPDVSTAPKSSEAKRAPTRKEKEVVRTDGPVEQRELIPPKPSAVAVEPQLPAADLALRGDGTGVTDGQTRSNFPDGVAATSSGVKVVLVRTHVLVTGSHHARVLSILEPGDRVQVEGTFGRWLRIRSKKGKVGYVFAGDVGEVEDFTSTGADSSSK